MSAHTNGTSRPKTAVARLRSMLADKNKIIVCPGVYDGFSARIALEQGFDCMYMVCPNSKPSPAKLPPIPSLLYSSSYRPAPAHPSAASASPT